MGQAWGGRRQAPGQRRRRPRRPRPRRLALLPMARALALAMAARGALYPAARRRRVPDAREAAQRPGCQCARWGQARAETRHGEPLLVRRRVGPTLRHGLCQPVALGPPTVQAPEAPGDRQSLGRLGEPGRQCLRRQGVHPLAAAACSGMTRQEVWHPEDLGGVRTDHRGALASSSADRPGGLGGDIPCGSHPQTEHVRHPTRLRVVRRLLHTARRLHRGRVGTMDPRVRLPPSTHQDQGSVDSTTQPLPSG